MTRITDTVLENLHTFMAASRGIILRMRNVSNKSSTEYQNTTFLYSVTFFFCTKSCRSWNTVGEYGTAGQATGDNIIRRMRLECWLTNATDVRICNIISIIMRTLLNVTLYVHCLSCYFFTLPHKRREFRRKVTEHKMCFLIFSTCLSETYLILRTTEWDMITNVHRASRKIPVILVRF